MSVALQMAAHEARSGHGKLAQDLREIVDKAKKQAKSNTPTPISRGLKDSSGLLYATTPHFRLTDLITKNDVTDKLVRVIREQRHSTPRCKHVDPGTSHRTTETVERTVTVISRTRKRDAWHNGWR